jgi:hypothetical protein
VARSDPTIVCAAGKRFYRSFSDKSARHVDHHGFANDPLTPSTIYTLGDGGIDNGTLKYHGADTTWKEIYGGDGGTVAMRINSALMLKRQPLLCAAWRPPNPLLVKLVKGSLERKVQVAPPSVVR